VTRPAPAAPPATRPIDDVLRASPALSRLVGRLRESEALFACIVPVLPAALVASVRPGPVDEAGWSILGANAAVAAKLRQLVPRLEQRLRDQGHPVAAVRVKVLPA